MIPERFRAHIERACDMFDINTPARKRAFLAQIAHESAGFTKLEEDLGYGPAGLLRTFPRRFTPEEAVEYAHDHERIANRVYGGRMGNGPQDGYRYRGRGLIQLTGRANYRRAGAALNLPLEDDPDLLLDPQVAAEVAAWFWADNGCNELADDGKFEAITRRINGGLNGLDDRLAWYAKFDGVA